MRRGLIALGATALLFVGAACNNGVEDVPDAVPDVPDVADPNTVTIEDFAYDPETLTVSVGDEVTWVNNDTAPHTATAEDGTFESENLQEGDEFSWTAQQAGTFEYYCEVHGADRMSGTIVVEE